MPCDRVRSFQRLPCRARPGLTSSRHSLRERRTFPLVTHSLPPDSCSADASPPEARRRRVRCADTRSGQHTRSSVSPVRNVMCVDSVQISGPSSSSSSSSSSETPQRQNEGKPEASSPPGVCAASVWTVCDGNLVLDRLGVALLI